MRLWIAAFFLHLFACQALPVAALGKHCVKMQLSGDNDDCGDEDDGGTAAEDSKSKKESPVFKEEFYRYATIASGLSYPSLSLVVTSLHRSDNLPVRYAGEVTSPPPDRT